MYRSMQPPNLTPWRLFPGTLPLTIVILAAACGDDPVDAPPVPTTVAISPATATLASFGETVQLTATVYDQHGDVMPGLKVSWSSQDASLVTVNSGGLVEAAGNGTTTVQASAGNAVGTAVMTVAQEVAGIEVTPGVDTFFVGDTLRLTAEATDANGHVVQDAEFSWASSDTLVVGVDRSGLATGLAAGEAGVTVTSSAVMDRAELTVLARVPTTVGVTPDTVALTALGQTAQLTAEVRDQSGRVMTDFRVSWSSADTTIATIDSIGSLTAAGNGTTTVNATAGDASDEAVVTVMQSTSSVVVSPLVDTVALGDTLWLVAEAFDENEHRVEGAEFTWSSSDWSVAEVDESGVVLGLAQGEATVTATSGGVSGTAMVTVNKPPPRPGPGLDIFDFPMRAIAISGYWGTNRRVAQPWEDGGQQGRLIPLEFIDWLHGMHANWILISVGLHYEDSMDSTVSRETDRGRNVPTWRDGTLRQVIREFRQHGFDIYMTLAFEAHEAETAARPLGRGLLGDPAPPHTGGVPPDEHWAGLIEPENWPWRPDHPDHEVFTAEFWETYTEQAEHFAAIAEDEGVALFSLGTETDALFRSRTDHSGYMGNDFGDELRTMVNRVRTVYSGRLTYNMHFSTLMYPDHYGRGSGAGHLWEDLDLDVVGISGWFPLTESAPSSVLSVAELQSSYESVFTDLLLPLVDRNPGRAIVFTEYGSMDLVEAPAGPGLGGGRHGELKTLVDQNLNELDDGEETQANIFQAFFNASASYPGLVNGAFFWDNWIATDAMWAEFWLDRRSFAVRGKLAEAVVREAYARLAEARR